MKKQSIVSAFSYPVRKAALIEEVSEKAARDGQSLSNLIVSLLEQYNQKNQEVPTDLSAIGQASRSRIEMGVNEDLRAYMPQIKELQDVKELREINLTAIEITKVTGNKLGRLLGERTVSNPDRPLSFSYPKEFRFESGT